MAGVALLVAVPSLLVTGGAGAEPSTRYDPVVPQRLLDTRPGAATIDTTFAGTGTLHADSVFELHIAGRGDVPLDASAAVVNMTAVAPLADGYLTMWPCDAPRPNTSNVNYTTGTDTANTVITKLAANGTVCIYTRAPTDLIVDLQGVFDVSTSPTPPTSPTISPTTTTSPTNTTTTTTTTTLAVDTIPTTTSTTIPEPSFDLPVLDVTLADYHSLVHGRRIHKDSPDDSYVEPTDPERVVYYQALRALLSGDLAEADAKFQTIGYALEYLTNGGTPLIAFQEQDLDVHGVYERGWGGGVLPVTAIGGVPAIGQQQSSLAYVMAPHTVNDTRTGVVGHLMFSQLLDDASFSAQFHTVYFWNTAYRYNSTKHASQGSTSTIADCSRDDGTMCREMSRALADHTHAAGKDVAYVVLHGYQLNENHQDAIDHFGPDDQPDDIILGTSAMTPMHQTLRDQLEVLGFPNTKLCGPGGDWPAEFGLCGDTDEVYRNLLVGGDVALHLEIETELRELPVIATTAANLTTAFRNAMLTEMS